MENIELCNLNDFIIKRGESYTTSLLSSFQCPLNPSIEYFLHHNAINFTKQNISITYLVFKKLGNISYFVGYFSIANKITEFHKTNIGKTTAKIVTRYANFNETSNTYSMATPLIAQFGKNFDNDNNALITGSELLELSLNHIKYIHSLIGGRAVYLECSDNPYLLDFYQSNNFSVFGKRSVQNPKDSCQSQLIQLFRFLK